MPKTSLLNSEKLESYVYLAVKGMQDKKAIDIVTLNLKAIQTAEADYMVICHATSDTHAAGVARSVAEVILRETGDDPWHTEGFENREWILLDYGSVLVHVFLKDKREFYDLESLWGDADIQYHEDES